MAGLINPAVPRPVTWAAGNALTAGRLRADIGNLAWLYTQRPLYSATSLAGGYTISQNVITLLTLDTQYIDNWIGGATNFTLYGAAFPGWYLCEGSVIFGSSAATGWYGAGIQAIQNSVTTNVFGNILTPNTTNSTGPMASDLVQLNPATIDQVGVFGNQTAVASSSLNSTAGFFQAEWVALPSTITGSNGVVVASPQPAALWPPGSGTTLTAPAAAGATSITVASNTGIVGGSTLGLEYS